MTPMWVERRSTISRMCEVRKIVPPRATNACSRSLICRDATASMPSNGSSRKSSRGAGSSAAASDSFLRMPCEKSATSVVAGVVEIHQREQVVGRALARVGAVEAVHLRPTKSSVSARRQAIEERQILGHDADPPLDRDRIGRADPGRGSRIEPPTGRSRPSGT